MVLQSRDMRVCVRICACIALDALRVSLHFPSNRRVLYDKRNLSAALMLDSLCRSATETLLSSSVVRARALAVVGLLHHNIVAHTTIH